MLPNKNDKNGNTMANNGHGSEFKTPQSGSDLSGMKKHWQCGFFGRQGRDVTMLFFVTNSWWLALPPHRGKWLLGSTQFGSGTAHHISPLFQLSTGDSFTCAVFKSATKSWWIERTYRTPPCFFFKQSTLTVVPIEYWIDILIWIHFSFFF